MKSLPRQFFFLMLCTKFISFYSYTIYFENSRKITRESTYAKTWSCMSRDSVREREFSFPNTYIFVPSIEKPFRLSLLYRQFGKFCKRGWGAGGLRLTLIRFDINPTPGDVLTKVRAMIFKLSQTKIYIKISILIKTSNTKFIV